MKKLITLFVILFFISSLQSQPGWHWQNPLPQGNPLNSINFLSDNGWAVGPKGTAIHTTDGGETWQLVDLGTDENLNSVYMHDDLMAFMAGDNGYIILVVEREDGFEITHYPRITTADLRSITSVSYGCPWAVGLEGATLRSDDFWFTFKKQHHNFPLDLFSIDNIECSTAFAVGRDGLVVYTNDMGNLWYYRNIPTTWDMFSVNIGTFENIRVVGQKGNIWHTEDEGLNWELEFEHDGYNLYDVLITGLNVSYTVGQTGVVLETTDYGKTWNSRCNAVKTTLYDVEDQWDYNQVWAVGHYGVILKNSGLETEFELQNEGHLGWLHSVVFANENEGWAVGGELVGLSGSSKGIVLHTTDGGENWDVQITPSSMLKEIDFINENEGWAVGRDGMIRYTVSGGDAWGTQDSPLNGRLESVCFIDEDNGWIVSSSNWGEIIHTSNGGNTWTKQTNATNNPLYDVFFIDEFKGWAVGLDSTIIRTTDGGQNWERVITNAANGYRFASVFFIDEMKGWVTGIYGSIMLTEDGGSSWQEIESGTSELLNSVFFIDHTNGWIAGDAGTILRTTNGGYSWFKQTTGVSTNFLSSIHFTNHYNGWAVGDGGTIIQTTNGGFSHPHGTFGADGLGLPIIDNEETKSTIEVDVSEVIRDEYYLTGVELMIDTIIHSRVNDLEIYLSHNDITDTLALHVTDDGENFLWTRLKDDATTMITDGTAPFSGDHKPYKPLSVFNGGDPNGEWTLTIYDSESGHTGTLNAWGIKPLFEKLISVPETGLMSESRIQMKQNIPNPFDRTTQINWKSDVGGHTLLKVFNISGQEITTLLNKYMPVGEHSASFDGSHLSTGVYYYQLCIGNYVQTKKMIIK